MNLLALKNILEKQFGYSFTIPPKLDLGVLTTSQAFIEGKKQRKNPAEIAQEIVNRINTFFNEKNIQAEAKNTGPYVNINYNQKGELDLFTSKSYLELTKVSESFCIDMFHPNVGKKMHVGHMRSGNLGETMRRILSLKYNKVISDNHLGDWGIQFSYTSWGIFNLDKLNLEFDEIDLDKEDSVILINKFYKIYVKVNILLEEEEEIGKVCKANAKLLEDGLQDYSALSLEEKNNYDKIYSLFKKIVVISLTEFTASETFLKLNQNPQWFPKPKEQFNRLQVENVQNKTGCHTINHTHQDGVFDMILGESFFISNLSEFDYLVQKGIAQKDGKAIYIDLEKQNLGRCYLISSEGYSLYHSRDIINRMIYAGIFEFDNVITFSDLRQQHSFDQVFAVLEILNSSGIYKNKSFGNLSQQQTDKAFSILKTKMAMFEGFGHLNLPEGTMSTRKGKIFEFSKLKDLLANKVKSNLLEKGTEEEINQDKIDNISIAALKWADLHRDREQDVIFDVDAILKFEGNTGVYQLYTIVRLNSILSKNSDTKTNFDISKLNQSELNLLRKTFTLPIILESISNNFKPHNLTSHLFDLSSDINSWYAKNNISHEADIERKKSLLAMITYLSEYLSKSLNLLGINTVKKL